MICKQCFFSYYKWNCGTLNKLLKRSFSVSYKNPFPTTSDHSDNTLTTGDDFLGTGSPTTNREHVKPTIPTTGVVFDIDGVIVRGRTVIKSAKEALKKLEHYNVPYIYLTNSGCESEEFKAQALEKHLGMRIDPDQIVLSHSPLRVLDVLHQKTVLVCGQGPVSEIAEVCGFSKVCHVDDIDNQFPELCVNDKEKRENLPDPSGKPFTPVEGIVLMGEPVNWEKSLQIIIDVILSSCNVPNAKHPKLNQQIPVVAVNTDLIWMSEAVNPRFGHGAFLLCVEKLFEKLTGKPLEYTAVLGKPNLLTYCYTENVLLKLAQKKFGKDAVLKTVYAVGDNPTTDIYGANVYNRYLKALESSVLSDPLHRDFTCRPERMKSILVRTGVYGSESTGAWEEEVNHLHRDTSYHREFLHPTHICEDVLHAVDTVLREEGIC